MKMRSNYHFGFLKALFLGFFVLFLFLTLVFPVHAMENAGLVEVRLSVPKGFSENVVVTFVNLDNYDEFATRLMKTNNYVSFCELPAGQYSFDGAFLEKSDFRYTTTLTSGNDTFTVSNDSTETSALLTLKTEFHSDIGTVVKPTDPPDPSVPVTLEPTSTGVSSEEQTVSPTGNNTKQPSTEPSTVPTEESTSPTEAATVPSTVTEPTGSEANLTTPGENASKEEETNTPHSSSGKEDPSSSKNDKKSNEDVTTPQDEENDEKQGLSWQQKLLYSVIATAFFVLIVFVCAYLFRRHLENS